MSVPQRYLTPPYNGDDEATRELLRRLIVAAPKPDLPRRPAQPVEPPTPLVTATNAGDLPARLSVDSLGVAPPPDPVAMLEGVARRQQTEGPVKDYSNVSYRPELGSEFADRTGRVPTDADQRANVEQGAVMRDLPVRIPELSKGVLADSVVQPPIANTDSIETTPSRIDPTARNLARNPGESATDYAARKHRQFEDELRTESPYSRVKETATGTTVDAPMKPHGLKQRAEAAALLTLRNMGAGIRAGGGPGAAGASIVSAITGLLAPQLAQKVGRQDQIVEADGRAKQLDEQQSREAVNAERQARTTDLMGLPQRRKDEERDKRISERERNWERLVATTGFDPVNNPEHRRIQLDAANDGQILPSTPPKPKPTREPEKQLITNQDGSQTLFEREPGEPNWHEAKGIPQSARKPSEAQDNRLVENEAKRQEYQAEEQQNRKQAEEYQQRSSDLESQAATLDQENKGIAGKHESRLTEGEKAQLAKAKELHTQAREAATKATEFWNKRAESDNKAKAVPQLKTRATGRGVGKTYTTAEVSTWAKSKGTSLRAARKLLESEGATIK